MPPCTDDAKQCCVHLYVFVSVGLGLLHFSYLLFHQLTSEHMVQMASLWHDHYPFVESLPEHRHSHGYCATIILSMQNFNRLYYWQLSNSIKKQTNVKTMYSNSSPDLSWLRYQESEMLLKNAIYNVQSFATLIKLPLQVSLQCFTGVANSKIYHYLPNLCYF